ncbi:MAG TPA: glycosyltransferase, partial [Solirubrobacterales bacterium]
MEGASLRLLMVANKLAPMGGAESQLVHLSTGLAANGHQVTVCAMDFSRVEPSYYEHLSMEVIELGIANRFRRPLALPRLISLARAAEIVHCTMFDSSLWGRLAAIAARRPVIVADHATDRVIQLGTDGRSRGDLIALHNRWLDRFTYATVACASEQLGTLLGEGVAPEKIVEIPNGIPLGPVREGAERARSRADLGLPPEGRIAIQIGLFRPEKNQLGALEAFAAVRAAVPDTHLVFVGGGGMLGEVEARADELGARAWVHFLGLRRDVPALLAHSDLMLLPSANEAMPMTVLEAMAVGVPVLASDVGDVRRTLGEAGVTVPPNDLEALSAQCIRLLGSPEESRRMGAIGAERAGSYDAAAMVH